MKTKVMLLFGAGFAGLSTAMFTQLFVGTDWGAAIGAVAGFTFVAVAFESGLRALRMASSFLVGMFGVSYFRFERHDAAGIVVALAALALSFGIAWPNRSANRSSSSIQGAE